MAGPTDPALHELPRVSGRSLILVRNPVATDARILREAEVHHELGLDPLIVGVTSTRDTERHLVINGTKVLRLSPRSPLSGLARLAGRSLVGDRPEPVREAVPAGTGRDLRPAPDRSAGNGRARMRDLVLGAHRLLRTLDFYRHGIGVLRRERPRLVHCNDYNTMWLGLVARYLFGSAVIYDAHELWADRNGRREPRAWLMAWEAVFVRAANAVVTTSPGYSDVISKRYRVPSPTVIRNVPRWKHDGSITSVGSDDAGATTRTAGTVVGYVGAVIRGRGLETAIGSIVALDDVVLRIIGPANPGYVRSLRRLIAEHGVAERVSLEGPVPPSLLREELTQMDIGLALIEPVCRSYELTLPNKLFEYAGAGLPVLASDLPVLGGLVRQFDAGEIADPERTSSVTAALRRLVEPRRRESAERGVRTLAQAFPWEAESRRLQEIYNRVLAGESSRG